MADERFDPEVKSSKGGLSAKVFIIGIPLFIIQLVGVYFIVGYTLQQKMGVTHSVEQSKETGEAGVEAEGTEGGEVDTNKVANHIFPIDDLLLNPAGTNGQAILLVSVGFGVNSQQSLEFLQSKEVLVRDMVITTLSAKGLDELKIENRDSLRVDLAKKVTELFPNVKISNIYFSKFIIQ